MFARVVAAVAVGGAMFLAAPGLADEGKRPIVAVFAIEARQVKLQPGLLASLTTYLASKLTESGAFEVVPEDRLRVALARKRRESYRSCFEQSCQIEIGRELAASKALATQVMKVGTKCVVACNLYDLRRATSGSAATVRGECYAEGISRSIDEVVTRLSGKKVMGTLDDAPARRARGWSGTVWRNIGPDVVVESVVRGGPAFRGGLRRGDILLSLHDVPMTSASQTVQRINSLQPGNKITAWVKRRGRRMQVKVVLGETSQATPAYQKACAEGDAFACEELGLLHAWGDGGLPRDVPRAAALYRKACDGGAMGGCRRLGLMYERGSGVTKDLARAVTLVRKACDGGDSSSCVWLASWHRTGHGLEQNLARAWALSRKACQADASSCNELGFLYETVQHNPEQAVVFYRKACDAGAYLACDNLGLKLGRGIGASKDVAQAVALFLKACDNGQGLACGRAGVMLATGEGVRRDARRAVRMLQRGCEAGHHGACGQLGRLYDLGDGVAQHFGKAIALYSKACNAKIAAGCAFLGVKYEQGAGVAKDLSRAAQLYQQACTGGSGRGCTALGKLHLGGVGVAANRARALELIRKGCSMGDRPGCELLRTAGPR